MFQVLRWGENPKTLKGAITVMKNRDKKRVAATGWMPYWWGNKFNKRLASKRARQHDKRKSNNIMRSE